MSQQTYDVRRGGRDGYRMRGDSFPHERDGGMQREMGMSYGGGYGESEMRGRSGMQQQGRFEQPEPHEAPIVKVIEVVAESERGWEDAAQKAVYEASRSVRNIKSIYIKDMTATVNRGRITHYRLVAKISFAIDQ